MEKGEALRSIEKVPKSAVFFVEKQPIVEKELNPPFLSKGKTKMLDGMMDVPWDEFGIPEVPTWIMQLSSSEDRIQLAAHRQLERKVIDKGPTPVEYGDLNQILKTDVAYHTVYFLIKLVERVGQNASLALDLIAIISGNIRIHFALLDPVIQHRAQRIRDELKKHYDLFERLEQEGNTYVKELATEILETLQD